MSFFALRICYSDSGSQSDFLILASKSRQIRVDFRATPPGGFSFELSRLSEYFIQLRHLYRMHFVV